LHSASREGAEFPQHGDAHGADDGGLGAGVKEESVLLLAEMVRASGVEGGEATADADEVEILVARGVGANKELVGNTGNAEVGSGFGSLERDAPPRVEERLRLQ
jgi:hypothetical protein